MKWKNYHYISLGIILLLITSSNAPSRISTDDSETLRGKIITYALPYDIDVKSYYADPSPASMQITSAIYSGLLQRQTGSHQWGPDLAMSMPTASSDGLTYTFTLKPNLLFDTGNPLTADDVIFSYQVALTSDINHNSYGMLSSYLSKTSITKVDTDTVQFTFKTNSIFNLQVFNIPIIDQGIWQSTYDQCVGGNATACNWDNPNGRFLIGSAGPFKIKSITQNQAATLVKNPNYYDATQVQVDILQFITIPYAQEALTAFTNGSIDIVHRFLINNPPNFASVPGAMLNTTTELVSYEMGLNHLNPYFGTGASIPGNSVANLTAARMVRQAMSYTVERQNYRDNIFNGLGQFSPTTIPADVIGWDANIPVDNYDITTARNLMQQAGFDYTSTGIDMANSTSNCTTGNCFFSLDVLVPSTNPARIDAAKLFANDLSKIGIEATVSVSSWSEIIPRTLGSSNNPGSYNQGGFDIFVYTKVSDYTWNPGTDYSPAGYCGSGDCSNFYNYENSTVTNAIDDYTKELSRDLQIAKLHHVQELLADDLPVIPILNPGDYWAYKSGITGLDLSLLQNMQLNWGELQTNRSATITVPDNLGTPPPVSNPSSNSSSSSSAQVGPNDTAGSETVAPLVVGEPYLLFIGVVALIIPIIIRRKFKNI